MNKFFKIFCFSVFACFYAVKGIANYNIDFDEYTDSLATYGHTIINGSTDFARYEAHEKFKETLIFILSHDNAISVDFSKVKNLSALGPKNNTFKIFTWVVPSINGSFECFGVFYSYNNNRKRWNIIELNDVKKEQSLIERKVLRKGEWFGALYYEIIPVRSHKIQYYTLLGWDGNNAFSTKKVIDVLSVNSSGQPSFGAQLFTGSFRHLRRVIFEYSSQTTMVLRYDKQTYTIKKEKSNRRAKKKSAAQRRDGFRALTNIDAVKVKEKRKSTNMIVFDRLSPLNPSLEGSFQFYVPEGNINDGFLFIDHKWTYVPDIDARNAPVDTTNHILRTPRGSRIPKLDND